MQHLTWQIILHMNMRKAAMLDFVCFTADVYILCMLSLYPNIFPAIRYISIQWRISKQRKSGQDTIPFQTGTPIVF